MKGSRLLIARREADLTQEQVCSRVNGLFRVTLAEIERDRVTPSRELADAIMEAIRVLKKEREDELSSRV